MIVRSVADVLKDRVESEVESIDRMYLHFYVPLLQSERGVAWFWRKHRGHDSRKYNNGTVTYLTFDLGNFGAGNIQGEFLVPFLQGYFNWLQSGAP